MNDDNTHRPLVIFADDDEDLLQLVKLKLSAEGLDVKLCLNGEKILSMIRSEKPDVVLLDITMNGNDGRYICKALKSDSETSSIPVILISANDNLPQIAFMYGADAYIAKPFNTFTIKQKIESLIAA